MKKIIFLCIFIAFLSGCETSSSQQKATLEMDASRPVTCQQGSDCEIKWSRAMHWAHSNSHWKLRIATDSLITTEGPMDTDEAAFSIAKVAHGKGQYSIDFRAACGNIFGCVPTLLELKAGFVNAVMGPANAPVAVPPKETKGKLKFGVTFAKNSTTSAASVGMPEAKGVMIISIADDSVAQLSGFRPGDVILKWGDVPVNDIPDMKNAVDKTAEGEIITITTWRYDEQTKGVEIEICAQF
jgi:hypothetical protein